MSASRAATTMLKRTDLTDGARRGTKAGQAKDWLDVAASRIGHLEGCVSPCSCGLLALQSILRRARGHTQIFYLEAVAESEDGLVNVALKSVEWPVREMPEVLTDADEDFLRRLMSVPQEVAPDSSMLPSNKARGRGRNGGSPGGFLFG